MIWKEGPMAAGGSVSIMEGTTMSEEYKWGPLLQTTSKMPTGNAAHSLCVVSNCHSRCVFAIP